MKYIEPRPRNYLKFDEPGHGAMLIVSRDELETLAGLFRDERYDEATAMLGPAVMAELKKRHRSFQVDQPREQSNISSYLFGCAVILDRRQADRRRSERRLGQRVERHMVAVTRDGDEVKLYIDGEFIIDLHGNPGTVEHWIQDKP